MPEALHAPVAALMRQACDAFVMPRFQALETSQIHTKSSATDLVTVADIEAEAWLSPRLAELLPGSLVLGEESASRGEVDADVLDADAPVWVIDPVDGTYNFVHGNPAFCCMIALVERRQVQAGWILFPTEGLMLWAIRGQGAQSQLGDEAAEQLRIHKPATTGAITNKFWTRTHLKENKAQILAALAPTQRTRCAGMDYRLAVTNQLTFVAMASLTAWDHAPGTLLVEEAGGVVRIDGGAYDPMIPAGTLVAGMEGERLQLAERLLQQGEL